MDIIRIKNAVFYAYHGALIDEQNHGGKFEVDVALSCDLSDAKATDALKTTIDYEAVYSLIRQLVTAKKYYLLEALASTIAHGILDQFLLVHEVTVLIRKPHPPVKGVVDHVEIEVTERRR